MTETKRLIPDGVGLKDTEGRVIQHQPLDLSLLDGLRNNYCGRDMRAPWFIAQMLGMPTREEKENG